MSWLKLTLSCNSHLLQDLGELLDQFDTLSVSFSPGSTEAVFADQSAVDKYWAQTVVTALFSPDIDVDILVACIRNRLGTENIMACRAELLNDEDWAESHKKGVAPMVFGNRLCICPGWCEPPETVPYVVELDPGLAFGTGTHPTTGLCLDWLANNDISGKHVIDYGCGSGILGLSAARLGASRVDAIDTDPQAILATRENTRKNSLEDKVLAGLPGETDLTAVDVLLANILLRPLLDLSTSFRSLLGAGGKIILSGILATQVDECHAAYARWFDLYEPVYRGEWALISGTRNQVQ